jgi:hypothetical protein
VPQDDVQVAACDWLRVFIEIGLGPELHCQKLR